MKILYLHTSDTIGSKKANIVSVLSTCQSFIKNGIDVELVMAEPKDKQINLHDYIMNEFNIELNFKISFYSHNPIFRKIEKYFLNKNINKILKNSSADYVFTRTPYYIYNILKYGKKVIFESHNNQMHDKYQIIDYLWKKRILKLSKNKNFSLFICISNNLKKYWLNKNIPNSKIIALHDGFTDSLFNEVKDKNRARKKLNIPLEKKIIMYVGSLYPDREIENILNLSIEFPNILFYVIGGPDKNKDYYLDKAKLMNIKNIYFTGYVSYKLVPEYLFSSDILLALWSKRVPTIDYCSPLKIFEYMASGKIIIAHSFITIREVLKNKYNALLVEPDNHVELVLALNKALKEKSNRLGIEARKEVYNNYTWDLRTKKIINAIKNA